MITTRNRHNLLREAVASARSQSLPNAEIVVVDDASADTTWDWLRHQARRGDIQALRNESPLERSASRNRGGAVSVARCILWLDDDDRLMPDALERLSAPLDRHPDAVAAVGARVTFDGKGNRLRIRHPSRNLKRCDLWRELLVGWVAPSGQTLFRKESVDEVGGWDETLATPEDQALWLQLSLKGPVCFVPHVVLEQRAHEGQWRPSDLTPVEAGIREDFVKQLGRSQRREAERLLLAWRERVAARNAQAAGEKRSVLIHSTKASWLARTLLSSPVIGSDLRRDFFSAVLQFLLPRSVTRALRARRSVMRAANGSEIDPTMRVSDRSAIRHKQSG